MENFYQAEGFNFNDYDLIVKDDELYAMYVKKVPYDAKDVDSKKPNRYGMVKSKDGVHWKEMGDIILPDPNGWDQSLWAGSISKQEEGYVIYYTAVLQKERQPSCKIGKAYSKDLLHWEKDPKNPALVFDSGNPYYSDEPQLAFRDPFFFEHEGRKYVIFCGRDKSKPSGKQGCVGLVEEVRPNEFKWLPPLFSPGKYSDGLECPAIYAIGGKWYLLYGVDSESMGDTGRYGTRYAVSEDCLGGYKEHESDSLPAGREYIGRIVRFKGEYLYYSWFRDSLNGLVRERLMNPRVLTINEREGIVLHEKTD